MSLGNAAKVLRVNWRKVSGRDGEMDWKGGVRESSERKITVSWIRVTACAWGRKWELAMPYGMSIHVSSDLVPALQSGTYC